MTGITLSPVQREMAEKIAAEEGVQASTSFHHMDGENMTFGDQR
jgi:cyclopropane fatty-acyl-phospholipid synthase-like methyltransferase